MTISLFVPMFFINYDLLVFSSSGESGLGWKKLFVFSYSGIGDSCQLETHTNWPLALVVS